MMRDKLLILLGNPPENEVELIDTCLSMAQDAVLDYIQRAELPTAAESAVIKLAIIYYNRLGNEGESSRTEGGISQSFITDIPKDIQRQLWRWPPKVGVIRATDEEKTASRLRVQNGQCQV